MTEPEFRLPPQDLLAEKRLLGSLVRRGQNGLDEIAGVVTTEDFYLHAHQLVFTAIKELLAERAPMDLAQIYQRLSLKKQVEDVGGAQALADIWESEPVGMYLEYSATKVAECAARRRVIRTCSEIIRDTYDMHMPADDLLARFESDIFAAGSTSRKKDEPVELVAAQSQALDELELRLRNELPPLIKTGYPSLDAALGGLRGGELMVIGARPSVGKSSLALNLSVNVAEQAEHSLFFSQEMSHVELAQRTLAMASGVPLHAIRGNRPLVGDETSRLAEVMTRPLPGKLWIDSRSHMTAHQVASKSREFQRKKNIKLVVIDYLQRMKHDARLESETLRVGESVKALKTLARNSDLPVICLAQLNRQNEGRSESRPRLSDLRGCGEIEQEADIVLLLHPEPIPAGDDGKVQTINVLIEKNRNGPCMDVQLEHVRRFTLFREGKNEFGL